MPAVAVIRRRLVLFIFNRFKGYLDGISNPKQGNIIARVLYEKGSIYRVGIKSSDTLRTGKGESNLLCKN